MKTGHDILAPYSIPEDMKKKLAKEIDELIRTRCILAKVEMMNMILEVQREALS